MANIGTTEAASALADYFGPHLEAGQEEGRRLMADALHDQFGMPVKEARRLVDALKQAHTIRWIVRDAGIAPGVGTVTSMPVVGAVEARGYWQLEPT